MRLFTFAFFKYARFAGFANTSIQSLVDRRNGVAFGTEDVIHTDCLQRTGFGQGAPQLRFDVDHVEIAAVKATFNRFFFNRITAADVGKVNPFSNHCEMFLLRARSIETFQRLLDKVDVTEKRRAIDSNDSQLRAFVKAVDFCQRVFWLAGVRRNRYCLLYTSPSPRDS